MENPAFPMGYFFAPKDYQALSYLRTRQREQPNAVPEVMQDSMDLFSDHPRALVQRYFGPNSTMGYFFTKVGQQKSCAAGFWRRSSSVEQITHDNNVVIGEKRLYNFRLKPGSTRTRWILYEYSRQTDPGERADLVLCHLYQRKARAGDVEEQHNPAVGAVGGEAAGGGVAAGEAAGGGVAAGEAAGGGGGEEPAHQDEEHQDGEPEDFTTLKL